MLVNKRELSDVMGVSQQALDNWQKQGLPIETRAGKGLENQYETKDVINWLVDREVRKVSSITPKDRLDNLRADEVEMRLAERCGQLIDAAEVENTWRTIITNTRIEFIGFAKRLEAQLRAKNIDPVEFTIHQQLTEIVSRMETMELPDADESESNEELTEDVD